MTTNKLAACALCTLLVTQLSACASGSPPKQQLALTQSSIDSAEAVGAAIHAKEPYEAAQQKLDLAKRFIDKKKYDKAKHQLELANADAKLALSEAKAKNEALSLTDKARQLQQDADKREQALRAQLAELEANKAAELEALKALQAKNTDRGMVLTLGDVLFDTNESTLKPGAVKNLDQVAAFLKKYPERSLQIEGHTDSIGDEEYNYNLSSERALAVSNVLQSQGITRTRIISRGLGENAPIASNDIAEGRQLNRRVELIFDHVEKTMVSGIDE